MCQAPGEEHFAAFTRVCWRQLLFCVGNPSSEEPLFQLAEAEWDQGIDITLSCNGPVKYNGAYGQYGADGIPPDIDN